ncbi:MAG TPA: tRNA-dihydrouridine synthase family protein, partial [Candidatus Eisenbacteria bacterium]|nr:tRNA-dihydrouridine synthase family protein [Candidatus Eisenbacteria bacterium]
MLRIGNIVMDGRVGLAPMAGHTEPVFRGLCREHGAAFVVTELVSSEGLVRGSERTNRYLRYEQNERPLGMQLFGSDPEVMGRAAALLSDLRPDFIDINMGCPVPKVVSREAGAALLRNKTLLCDLASAVVAGARVPVTAKIRSGWDRESSDLEHIGAVLEASGVSAIAIHARTRSEGFSGAANWSDIRRLKQAVSVPVIGNGDVRTAQDARRMFEETGCDG